MDQESRALKHSNLFLNILKKKKERDFTDETEKALSARER